MYLLNNNWPKQAWIEWPDKPLEAVTVHSLEKLEALDKQAEEAWWAAKAKKQ